MGYSLEIDTDSAYSRRDIKTDTIREYYKSLEELDTVTLNFNRDSLIRHFWDNKCVTFVGEVLDIRIREADGDNLGEELSVMYEDDAALINEYGDLKEYCIYSYVKKLEYSQNDLENFLFSVIENRKLEEYINRIYLLIEKNANIDYAQLEMELSLLLDIYFDDYLVLRRAYFEIKKDLGDMTYSSPKNR